MTDTIRYYLDQDFGTEKVETEENQDVLNIVDLFRMLSIENKIEVIRKLRKAVCLENNL